jgi:RNA polymerase sigma-70 factor (ECF subfamily)
LPTKQQLAFNLRYYDDLGYDEIAGIIGSTADGVKSSYHIAKDKIIKYMNSNN